MSSLEAIPEDEVTIDNLRDLLDRAFYRSEIDEDGDVAIIIRDRRMYLDIRSSAKVLGYSAFFSVKEDAPIQQRHALVNRLNDSIVMVRFSIREQNPGVLVADYHLSYEGGISPFQVVTTLRNFDQIIVLAMSNLDEDDIIS